MPHRLTDPPRLRSENSERAVASAPGPAPLQRVRGRQSPADLSHTPKLSSFRSKQVQEIPSATTVRLTFNSNARS